jgi:hypothetical protein
MYFRSLVGVLLLVLTLVYVTGRADEPAKKLSDAAITKLMVGKWYEERKEKGLEVNGTETFRNDGTFSGEATFKRQGQTLKVAVTGSWKVVDNVLTVTIETCNPPVIKKGRVSRDQVLSVTEKEFRYKYKEDGKERVKSRVVE